MILSCAICKSSQAQTISNKALVQGIEEFYSAQFEESIRTLREVAASLLSSKDELFAAHLYLAFCYIRQNGDSMTVRQNFVKAILANPNISLDPNRIPPDLYNQFKEIHKSMVGGLVVQTDPAEATVMLVEPEEGRQINKDAPAHFPSLLEGTYSLIISKEGYKLQTTSAKVTPGATDTVSINLAKKSSAFYTRWWAWGGGLALATALAIYESGNQQSQKEKPAGDLPDPPQRP